MKWPLVPHAALATALVSSLLFPAAASAYLDPGSGSFVFQVLMGLFLTVTFAFRKAWSAIILAVGGFLRRLLPHGSRQQRP